MIQNYVLQVWSDGSSETERFLVQFSLVIPDLGIESGWCEEKNKHLAEN